MPDHQTTTFDVALRGYDREQVDQHLVEVRSDFDSVLSERDELAVRVRQLQQRLEDLHLSTADEEPADELPVSSLTGFGARVEKILRLAEDEATALREETRHDVEQERADAHAAATREEASGHLEAVRARAAQAAADFETALAKRRQKAEADHAARTSAAERELGETVARTDQLRAEAEKMRADAERRSQEMLQAAQRESAELVAEARAQADRTRRESERDLAALAKRRDAITEQLRNVREMLSTLTGGVVPASESDGAAELDAEVPAPRSRSGRAAVGDGAQG